MVVFKAYSRSQNRKYCGRVRDRIRELPDDILGHILSLIPTMDAFRTSILSKRWRNVWTFLPFIDIKDHWVWNEDYWERPRFHNMKIRFKRFIRRLQSLNEVTCIRKFRLSCFNDYDLLRIREWLNLLNKLDNFEELDLEFSKYERVAVEYPLISIFTHKKLVSLKVTKDVVLNVPFLVCFPSLKIVHLVSVRTLDTDSFNNLIAGCPVLEELYISLVREKMYISRRRMDDNMNARTLYVQSSSLKNLTVRNYISDDKYLLVIDASNLERLDLALDAQGQIEVINSLSCLVRVRLAINNYYTELTQVQQIRVIDLLRKMSNSKDMHLSFGAMESFEHGRFDHLPMFKNLTHLEVDIISCSWPSLPSLLESSPNLISFIVLHKDTAPWRDRDLHHLQSRMPKCLMLYLEKIELIMIHGCKYQMELISYFLKNAPVLKTMSIKFGRSLKPHLRNEVLMLPKASTECEIEFIKSFNFW